ncbi:histidine kinase-, DNA gyrase b-, and HSP90-like ATPase domain-containing protein [Sarocladium implicatum]|nr:histidine kinase-, DNA gyrase b-, and HSP90-like ATPase domain-containing protein [Sarocladium implicatum]
MIVPVKAVSEATREREAFRYAPLLLTGCQFSRDGNLPRRIEQSGFSDAVLTALAQLGTYRTHTGRGFISLFDTSHQYIIAEATPSTRISPNLSADASLNLGGSAIPRQQGTCDHVLYLPTPETVDGPELPLSFVPDLTKDSRFCKRPYCQFGEKGQFYAGVPLRTPRGIDIGAYCVMATEIPQSWNDQCAQDLRDISQAIMDHLELKRSQTLARRHERINRGIGSFVEGKATLSGWHSATNQDAFKDDAAPEGNLNSKQQDIEMREYQDDPDDTQTMPQPERVASNSADGTRRSSRRATSPSSRGKHVEPSEGSLAVQEGWLTTEIYSRAANIIREAFEIEGSMWINAPANLQSQLRRSSSGSGDSLNHSLSQVSSTSSSDEQPTADRDQSSKELCKILGSSTSEISSINSAGPWDYPDSQLSERTLGKLLRRYPAGKIWNFDATGGLQSSDSSEEDHSGPVAVSSSLPTGHLGDSSRGAPKRQNRRMRPGKSQEGFRIRQAFPSARSVAFFPLWDSRREKWLAGGFIYTLNPTRLFSPRDELSLLTAFGKLVVSEILNLETLQADKAKSDVLGSLSHELRSPLHGAILGTELLQDTELSAFQGSATHTIETCCRTMLDTIEHLLDYAKVNSFAEKRSNASNAQAIGPRPRSKTEQFGKKLLSKHIRIDALVEEVIESVFLGFEYQRVSVQQVARQERSGLTDSLRSISASSEPGKPGLPTIGRQAGQRAQQGNVAVFISADSTCDWAFYTQPGAIRRIVMNLFGNSLKYTTEGTIRIDLLQEPRRGTSAERLVKLIVHDTGKGISDEYLRHKLFKSFSQEDELSPGTGLGLSLVKMITSQLRGQISVDSKVGVGTTVTVTLPLEPSRLFKAPVELSTAEQEFEDQRRDLAGLRIRIEGFASQWSLHLRGIVEHICSRWLELRIVQDGGDEVADIALWSSDALPESVQDVVQLSRTPNVVMCRDAVGAHRLLTSFRNTGQGQNFDFISQPIGPRALARSLLLAYRQWVGVPNLLSLPRPPGPVRSHSLDNEAFQSPKVQAADFSSFAPHIKPSEEAESKPSDAALEVPDDQPPPATAASIETPSRFLLVDDNHINLKVLSVFMRKLDRKYETAVNGQEAVDAFERRATEIAGILMDISMPVMDGLDATRRIRAYERKKGLRPVPIVALTGLASHSVQQEARESGVDVFLTKPVSMKALNETLKSIDERPNSEGDAQAKT